MKVEEIEIQRNEVYKHFSELERGECFYIRSYDVIEHRDIPTLLMKIKDPTDNKYDRYNAVRFDNGEVSDVSLDKIVCPVDVRLLWARRYEDRNSEAAFCDAKWRIEKE